MTTIWTVRLAAVAALAFGVALAAEARADKSGVRPNVISVPGGPGTIGGLGEQFEPTLNTGSATYDVALDVPPGTAGFSPQPRASLRQRTGQRRLSGWAGRWTSARCNGRRRTASHDTTPGIDSSGRGKSWCPWAAASTA